MLRSPGQLFRQSAGGYSAGPAAQRLPGYLAGLVARHPGRSAQEPVVAETVRGIREFAGLSEAERQAVLGGSAASLFQPA